MKGKRPAGEGPASTTCDRVGRGQKRAGSCKGRGLTGSGRRQGSGAGLSWERPKGLEQGRDLRWWKGAECRRRQGIWVWAGSVGGGARPGRGGAHVRGGAYRLSRRVGRA